MICRRRICWDMTVTSLIRSLAMIGNRSLASVRNCSIVRNSATAIWHDRTLGDHCNIDIRAGSGPGMSIAQHPRRRLTQPCLLCDIWSFSAMILEEREKQPPGSFSHAVVCRVMARSPTHALQAHSRPRTQGSLQKQFATILSGNISIMQTACSRTRSHFGGSMGTSSTRNVRVVVHSHRWWPRIPRTAGTACWLDQSTSASAQNWCERSDEILHDPAAGEVTRRAERWRTDCHGHCRAVPSIVIHL